MKFLIVVVMLAASCLALPVDDKTGEEYMNKLIRGCMLTEKTPEAEVLALRKKGVAKSKEAKCLIGCMFDKMGFLVNGKFSKANADKAADELLSDTPDMLRKAKMSNENCDKVAKAWGADKCANGPALYACMKQYEPDLELFPPQ